MAGTFDWIRSLKKDLVTSGLRVPLPGGLVTIDGGHCSRKDLWVLGTCARWPRRVCHMVPVFIQMNNTAVTLLF